MSFTFFILSNLLRQKVRTGLTVLGISIGITTVVALGIFVNSLKASTEELITAGGSDFAVAEDGVADLTFSTLTTDDLALLETYDDIEHVSGVELAISKVGANSFFFQFGVDPSDLSFFEAPLVDGRRLAGGAADEIMLGDRAAGQLGAEIGDSVEIRDLTFTVVGIYDTRTTALDGGAILPLATVQEYDSREGLVTLAYIHARKGADVAALTHRIEAEHPGLATLAGLEDIGAVDQSIQMLDAVNLGIMVLAVFIGGIAVMNTMVMAVFERTREFGILRALGWRTRRILQMVLGEALLLCLIASVFGSILAVALTQMIVLFPTVSAFITPQYTLDVFLRGLAVGIGVALLGAIYPAYRAARLSPAQAIRYE
ncbi:MAG: ABC transporter permease [Chloroflexi bacterium]|nr:ABC transporter permease [Chloroflexota bacterium]